MYLLCFVRTLMQQVARYEKRHAKHTHGTKDWIGAALDFSKALSNLAGVLGKQVRLKHPTGAQRWCIGTCRA